MKKLYQVLVILDDVADMPQLHKPNGALDLKPRNEMFFKRFEERFVIENADGSGAQLPGPEAVRQFHTH